MRPVRAYLALGLALVVAYHWFDRHGMYWAIALYGAAGAALGAVRSPRGQRAPWVCFAGGVLLWVLGDVEWQVETMLGRTPGSPGISDGLYFVAYPLVAVALVLLARQTSSGGLGTTIDAAILAITVSAALWPVLFATVMNGFDDPLGTRLTAGIYPCWDVLFLAISVRIGLTRALHTRRMLLLLGAVSCFLVGDLFWFDSVNTYALGDWMDYAWLTAYVGFGAAALHPSAVRRGEARETSASARFALLALPVALLPVVELLEDIAGHPFSVVDAAFASILLLLLLGRLGMVLRGLEQTRGELREQNRLKDELISVVSHDLRTPLTSIMGYLELALAEDTDPATAREFLAVVQRNTSRLHRLVEDLLFVSRVQSGREALDLAPVDLAQLACESVANALPTAEAAEIELSCVVEREDMVVLDAHRITEVLENLLSNAIKFTPPGGRVRVWVGRSVDRVVIRVADTGVGIGETDRRHLFERFYRSTLAEGIPGAGLGLSIVKAIVDAHDGEVAVESVIGAGTTFEVSLPLSAVALEAERHALAA